MAGSATITGRQNYVLGIGHPKNEAPTEGAPAVFSADGKSLVGVEGSNIFKFKPVARSLVLAGDSITAQGMPNNGITTTTGKYSNNGWWVHALTILGWPLNIANMAAVSGRTSQQILAGFDTEIKPYQPDWVWAIIGQNNLGDADNGAQCIADIREFANKCISIGAKLLIGTVTPRTAGNMTALIKGNIIPINRAIRAMQDEGLVYVFDSCAALTDPASADGASVAGLQYDTLHPNAAGAAVIGRVAASTVDSVIPIVDTAIQSNADSRLLFAGSVQLIANPKLSGNAGTVGTGGSGVCATSFNLNRQTGAALTVAGSKIAETGPKFRTWQRMTFGGTVASGIEVVRFQQTVAVASLLAPLEVGSILKARATLKQGAAALSSNLQFVRVFVEILDSVPALIANSQGLADSNYQCNFFPASECVVESAPLALPAGAVSLRITINVAFAAGACSGDLDATDFEVYID